MVFTVVITEPIHRKGVDLLIEKGVRVIQLPPGSNENTLMEVIKDTNVLITRGGIKITREMMEVSPRLQGVGVHGIGCDHVDLNAARELGKIVFNTPDALSVTVAEMTMALILSLFRRVVSADKAVRAGEWNRKYMDLIGLELQGKTVGILGMGRIGSETARRLKAFRTDIIYWSRTRKPELEKEIGMRWNELDDLLANSDILTLHIPGTAETHHLIGEREFGLMKEGVLIVNTARGRIIDQTIMIDSLKNGRLAGAALDVFDVEPLDTSSELVNMDNVILTPHLGASSLEGMQRMAEQVAVGVLVLLGGRMPNNVVN